jgi:hypothetical protein
MIFMFPDFFWALAGIIVVIGSCYTISAIRRGSSVLGLKTSRLDSFSTALSPAEAIKKIIDFAQKAGYKISAIDNNAGQLVLEEPASFVHWGFFFPVSISRQSDDPTLVEVGIKSKLFSWGPILSRSHERCISGIKATLLD